MFVIIYNFKKPETFSWIRDFSVYSATSFSMYEQLLPYKKKIEGKKELILHVS